ncbi:MAG TPA: hypothetical protein VLH19_02715 [Patescibacteria group bacterium]|nr:hypothetical protein [Patescibacteria group bacterium]
MQMLMQSQSTIVVSDHIEPNSSPDTIVLSPLEGKTGISIEQIQSLPGILSFAPVKDTHKVVILFPAHTMSLPAQQALLKILEEPPGNSQIVLVTPKPMLLLATIRSRCVLISTQYAGASTQVVDGEKMFREIAKATIGEKIELAEKYGKKDEALAMLEDLLLHLKNEIDQKPNKKLVSQIQLVSTAIHDVSGNVNVRLTLEDLFFKF